MQYPKVLTIQDISCVGQCSLTVALPILYSLLGRKRLYPLIAKGEYDAEKKYEALVHDFEEVKTVQADEHRHGDTVLALLKK